MVHFVWSYDQSLGEHDDECPWKSGMLGDRRIQVKTVFTCVFNHSIAPECTSVSLTIS